jgi:hypothetical protein
MRSYHCSFHVVTIFRRMQLPMNEKLL